MSTPAALRSPWTRVDAAVPLLAWRAAQIAQLGEQVQSALAGWREAWGLAGAAFQVTCAAVEDGVEAGTWTVLGQRDAATAWVDCPATFDEALARALLDVERPTTPLAKRLLQRCRADGMERLAGTFALGRDQTAGRCAPMPLGPWSGAVQARLPWGARVVLNQAAVRALVAATEPAQSADATARRPALAGIAAALAEDTLTLRAQLLDCELDVGSLQDLQVGDVVRVQHALDNPLQVLHGANESLFTGHLVQRGGLKAIELAGLPARAVPSNGKVHP